MKNRLLSLMLAALLLVSLFPLSASAADIVDSGACGENLTWTLDSDGLLTISGTGAMYDYTNGSSSSPFGGKSSIKSAVIEPGVTSIGAYAFRDNRNLTSLTIPDSVTSISYYAVICGDYHPLKDVWYSGTRSQWEAISIDSGSPIWMATWHINGESAGIGRCGENLIWTIDDEGLVTISGTGAMTDYLWNESPFFQNTSILSVIIEPGVTSIGNRALISCSSLTNVTIPESVTSIGVWAFSSCSSLTNVTIPESVTSIGGWAFSSCSSLTSITILGGVTSIGSNAFENCSSLTSAEIPESVTGIGNYAFENCSSLTSVTIMDGVESIESAAFRGCSSLTSVEIPESVTSIGNSAFSGCSGMTTITIPDTVTRVGAYALQDCSSLTEVFYGGDEATWKRTVDASNVLLLEAPHIHLKTASPDGHFRTITVPATCETEGYTARTCDCGYEYDRVVTEPALGHDWTPWATLLEPTATTKGIAVRICANDPKHVEFKALPTVAGDPSNPFTDVAEGKFYHDPVLWAISQNPQITTGVTATTFEPDRTCTRAHVVTFLWRANGCPEPQSMTSSFKDVKDTSKYYYKAVLWASEQGITTGYSDGTFRPDDECSRGQVVTFLWRAKGQPKPTSTANPFNDVPAGKYYTTAVLWALENNITKGRTATTFGPDDACTRGHVVTFLYRAYA